MAKRTSVKGQDRRISSRYTLTGIDPPIWRRDPGSQRHDAI
jgi:hypothetical protein